MTRSMIFVALLLSANVVLAQDIVVNGKDLGFGLATTEETRKIAVTGEGLAADSLTYIGPTYWFSWPHYVWLDFTADTSALRLKDAWAALGAIQLIDAEYEESALDVVFSVGSRPDADYELFCTDNGSTHTVTAINHNTGKSETVTISQSELSLNKLKALHPVLQALTNVM